MKVRKREQELRDLAAEIEEVSAVDAGELGFFPRWMAKHCLPVHNYGGDTWVRRNGDQILTARADAFTGIPFGAFSRLCQVHVTSQIKQTSSAELYVGNSLSAFVRQLKRHPSGGKNGCLKYFRMQLMALLSCSMSYQDGLTGQNFCDVKLSDAQPWRKIGDSKWDGYLPVRKDFIDWCVRKSVPVDLRVVDKLVSRPLEFDIHCMLSYRYVSMKLRGARKEIVSIKELMDQFATPGVKRSVFYSGFEHSLSQVRIVYSNANCELTPTGLTLHESPPHVETKRSQLKRMRYPEGVDNSCVT